MPGIHIRTLSHLDWLEQEKESVLIIPGSYWLCHKKNIYKFIFRYHRTVRNTMQFSYGRELLKIIRRIIKCHPTQGQQFGTQHLLVTYSCTSWTRQDKMFAIMKFQQRTNAAAFSHAFVLTIRTFPSSECSLFDLKYPIVKEADADSTFKDLNVSLDSDEKMISTVISTDQVSSRNATICQIKKLDQISNYSTTEDVLSKALETTIDSDFQDDGTRHCTIFCENLDKRTENTTAETHFVNNGNTEFHNVQENDSINCNIERHEKNVEQYSTDCVQEQSLRTKTTDKIELEKIDGIKNKKETKFVVIQKASIKPLPEIVKNSSDEWLLIEKINFIEKAIEKDDTCTIITNNKNNLSNKNMTNDSSNAPQQYFIEKEEKANLIIDQPVRKNLQIEVKNIDKDKDYTKITKENKSIHVKHKDYYNEIINLEGQENDRQHTETSINIDDKQLENNMYSKSCKIRKQKNREFERKTKSDKVLRSSDITDLVMEGLMFTIRQDQDSVAVIEQKTKLEMDEVLENSEKVETKGGEKCLLNSSLLRLENLVTMIDSPRNKDEQHKNHHTIGNGANLSLFNVFHGDAVHDVNINYVDVGMDKSGVLNYDGRNAINHLNLYQSQWQHQCVSSNIKNDGCSTASGLLTEKEKHLMEWQNDNEKDEEYKSSIEMKKQEGDITPESLLFKKINTGLRNTDSLTINKNIEDIDKRDNLIEEHYKSQLSYSSLNPNKTCETHSKESNLIKSPRQEANVPRIISDKAITIEQMSPALQKVLQHTCRAYRFSSTISSGTLQQAENKTQHQVLLTEDTVSEANDLLDDKFIKSNVANNLSLKFSNNSEKIESNNEKSCITVKKDVLETNGYTHVRNSRKNATQRTLRRNSSSKHSSSRKLQDITEEFYYDLLHIHNQDNAIRQRCLRQKQKLLNNPDDVKSSKVRIEMLKFIQDITKGARVVVKRLNIDKSNLLEKNSNLI
ncbi:uncharacterized protein LOC105837781 [Monomorium pharaonis]|uniref:uncharacterized protein LOC105837781 n=1 Tax=Monomorium pharaonis TaxID=307658 RepID=UPI0017467664|nr:uncharacterized protein LOC105837781 [Monomorium pharaonis]XP_012538309.2 uncharacterized protein LOC105837781 [Monomorium pharaonis]XP_012538310.2 uncharacterized protein LOC105837781 [Monomorium pharaonis]XP_028047340.2 uncharacterized protein LOC105837781 [Monomorium pharaonis]XP_028047341.2 uncharacterized protein LOC105837781 [Monomorium pharaonis]